MLKSLLHLLSKDASYALCGHKVPPCLLKEAGAPQTAQHCTLHSLTWSGQPGWLYVLAVGGHPREG